MSGGCCADCLAVPVDDELSHDDRAFFEANPGVFERRRPLFWSEVVELRSMGVLPPVGEVAGTIAVRLLGEGLRAKFFDEVYVLLPTDVAGVAAVLAWAVRRKRSA